MEDIVLQLKALSNALRTVSLLLGAAGAYALARWTAIVALNGQERTGRIFGYISLGLTIIALALTVGAIGNAILYTLDVTTWHAVFSGEAASVYERKGWLR